MLEHFTFRFIFTAVIFMCIKILKFFLSISSLCMFTACMYINNRSFFPCQEFGSLSTWQAYISTIQSGAKVLMSGDNEGTMTTTDKGNDIYVSHHHGHHW